MPPIEKLRTNSKRRNPTFFKFL